MAKKYGVYLEDKGITDRATVIIDKGGVVRYAASVTPQGERNPRELLAECQKVNNQNKR
jgi:alkyl hydroperoxide reductase subunit AhpC